MTMSMQHMIDYRTKGYAVIEQAFTDTDLQPLIEEIGEFVRQRAEALHAAGKIADLCEREPFERRFAALYEQCHEMDRQFDIMYLRGPAMFAFLKNGRLLDIVECVLGSEIACNPIQHVRPKLSVASLARHEHRPDTPVNVPWHQDDAVTVEESEYSDIVTFWLPLIDATPETGCMEIIPYAFKHGYIRHYSDGGTTIVPQLIPRVQPDLVPCPKGGLIVMNKYTPHRGTPNVSDNVRWTLDLRYHRTGTASGRPYHPEFVARSRLNPASELSDHGEWCRLWEEALAASQGMSSQRVEAQQG